MGAAGLRETGGASAFSSALPLRLRHWLGRLSPEANGSPCGRWGRALVLTGLYETSGDWLVDVGVPGKSGIGGGIVVVAPGKGALGTYAPLLDAAGNSVRGQLAAEHLARRLGLDVLASQPWTPRPRPPS